MFKEENINKLKVLEENLIKQYKGSVLVFDGVIDYDLYAKSKTKILWILKEVNGSNDKKTWDLRKFISDRLTSYPEWRRTFKLIIYVSYGILNDFPEFEQLDDPIKLLSVLKEIAIINLNKNPGASGSNYKKLSNSYKNFRDTILSQIELIDPDIIIGGNTLSYLYSDLGISGKEINKSNRHVHYLIKDDKLLINAYHPGQRKITHNTYYSEIIEIVKSRA